MQNNVKAFAVNLATVTGVAMGLERLTKTRSKDNPNLLPEMVVSMITTGVGVFLAHKIRSHYGVDRNAPLVEFGKKKTK